jgi:hypothetical protein
MKKNIPIPLAILIIFLVVAAIVVITFLFCLEKERILPREEADETESGMVSTTTRTETDYGQDTSIEGWQTYSNLETDLTFKYPKNWEIIEDYFYETAGGIKSENRTVILQKIGDNDSNNWIRINPRQFQCSAGICLNTDNNIFATYSKEPEIQDIFNQILSTFKLTESIEICVDNCGNEMCEGLVCMAIGCPCAETKESCPQDCEAKTEPETVQVEIKDFTTDKDIYGSNEELRASSTVLSPGGIKGVMIKLIGIKPNNYAYINSSQTVDLNSGENEIIFIVITPHCTSGCGGVYPGPYDLNVEVFVEEKLVASSTVSITLTND